MSQLRNKDFVSCYIKCNIFLIVICTRVPTYDSFNPLNPAARFSGLRKQGAKNLAGRFSGICYGVSKTRRASKPAHVRPIKSDLFTPEGIRLHLGHKLKVQACLVFAQYAIF